MCVQFHRLELRIKLSFQNLTTTLPIYLNREAAKAVWVWVQFPYLKDGVIMVTYRAIVGIIRDHLDRIFLYYYWEMDAVVVKQCNI